MALNRRDFLLFLGVSASTVACGRFGQHSQLNLQSIASLIGFEPVKGPMPLVSNRLTSEQQIAQFAQYDVVDDVVLPAGFIYDVIASWGDRVGNSRFGYNNDYLSFVETGPDKGFLTVNFEYISAVPWLQTYTQVIGKSLPLSVAQPAVEAAVKAAKPDSELPPGLNAFALPDNSPVKQAIKTICREALIDQGLGVIAIQRGSDGKWQRTFSQQDRRVTGISGLEDGRYLKVTGPAAAVFRKTQGQGYVDQLGDRIIGTFQNCAGGTTPWGTVLSGEENIQNHVPEPVYADGTSFDPKYRPFMQGDEELSGLGNVFGLAGNKYGWIVEIDPTNSQDPGTKHSWLGRYRHEAVGIRVVAGKPLAFYSGCDRRGGHLYKFVSTGNVTDPTDKSNSKLLSDGMLYAAQFNPDGSGRWIPLTMTTPINPIAPTFHSGAMLPLPNRPGAGIFRATDDEEVEAFRQKYQTLGDLYSGSLPEKQGAILIDAHLAANAAGATCTARPEDTEIGPNGDLFITFTSGAISKEDGSPDLRIFKGPDGSTAYEYGWIMQLSETNGDPQAQTFKWKMLSTGGEPSAGGQGFSNPDNLAFDPKGNLWMVNDMSSGVLNRAVPADRLEPNGAPVSPSNLRGVFGNNAIWYLPLSGELAGQMHLFGISPIETEATGPYFTKDGKTLFLAIQHPGEINGTRQNQARETRRFAMKTTEGQPFEQIRAVPIGSNWPARTPNAPPKPAVIAIRHQEQRSLIV
ncbi:MAG: PhoX family protein [Leptolyngbyaceae cyanobacterium]